jgi:hypothetical protein
MKPRFSAPSRQFLAKNQEFAGDRASFQMAEVAVSRQMFADILSLIARLRYRLRGHDEQ